MREIKFRAWNIKTKEYNKYVELYSYLDGSLSVSAGVRNNNNVGSSENFVLEQFTGLKDKNGKDIYEGDILCTSDNTTILVGYRSDKIDSYSTINVGFTFYGYGSGDIEVIGNMHENPELFTK